jgi:hypothetical protein
MPAQLIGIVYDRADEQAAIKHAIEALKVREIQRDRLSAQRRDWAIRMIGPEGVARPSCSSH